MYIVISFSGQFVHLGAELEMFLSVLKKWLCMMKYLCHKAQSTQLQHKCTIAYIGMNVIMLMSSYK